MSHRPRIAILGGGVGAVTAAVQLSKAGWEDHFESITLYQQGWRLGGKGACGRGPDMRIEEHGLHIWFGFYENAFRMMHLCHEELDRLAMAGEGRWRLPFTSVAESFHATSEIALTDHDGCGWKLWVADFFEEDSDRPWADPDPRPPGRRPEDWTVAFYMERCLRLAADFAWSLVRSDPGLKITVEPAGRVRAGLADLGDVVGRLSTTLLRGDLRQLLSAAADTIDALAGVAVAQPVVRDVLALVARALDLVLELLRSRYDRATRASDSLRRAYYIVDLMIAIVRGLIDDGVVEAKSFTVIDDIDFRHWLLAHGASRASVDCALVRGVVYDIAFAYEGGDPQHPSCAAGTAVRGLLRTFFTYRGALMWKMNAGMGDVVFAPLYELLVKRGVEVRFFHRVEAVRASNGLVEEIEIDVQEAVPSDTDPLSYLSHCQRGASPDAPAVWPAAPPPLVTSGASAIATRVAIAPETYESWYTDRSEARVSTKVLRRGAASDGFELVVFGLPISCVGEVAPDLVAESPRWRAAVDHVKTVPTQAMQLWLDKPAAELGDAPAGAVVGGFVEPFDTWADMPQLVPHENVAGSVTVAYFCSALADSPPPARGHAAEWLRDQRALVRAQAVRFLTRDIGALWPHAVDPLSGEFDWQRLVAPAGVVGEDRLDFQYLRANVEPSERYVLSVPGTGAHRIEPTNTGFGNLYAAGDWTSCTLDAGCVEAAVISGMLAANGINRTYGDPSQVETIIGRGGP